mmetsp:Transcript_24078/g.58519  ORF Transcript_24078/g.58519 Transcript_24078/m.58519 type:complete len:343 (+) Transcript_24078:38-1066(+)
MIKNTFLNFQEEALEAPIPRRSSSIPPMARLSSTDEVVLRSDSPASVKVTPSECSTEASPSLSCVSLSECEVAAEFHDAKLPLAVRALLSAPAEGTTTVTVHNIPGKCTPRLVLRAWRTEGLLEGLNLFYLPMDFKKKTALGQCYLNFATEVQAAQFRSQVDGTVAGLRTKKPVAAYAARLQGFRANFREFWNSLPELARAVPEFLPIIFDAETGGEVPLSSWGPPPRRAARPPAKARGEDLGARLFQAVSRVVDEHTARMVVGHAVQAPPRQVRATLAALEEGDNATQAYVQQCVAHLCSAGYMVPANLPPGQVMMPPGAQMAWVPVPCMMVPQGGGEWLD